VAVFESFYDILQTLACKIVYYMDNTGGFLFENSLKSKTQSKRGRVGWLAGEYPIHKQMGKRKVFLFTTVYITIKQAMDK